MFQEISKREFKLLASKLVHRKKIIGLDIGHKRIGVAISDGHHQISVPWGVLQIGTKGVIKDTKLLNSFKSQFDYAMGIVVGEAIGLDGYRSTQSGQNRRILGSLMRSHSLPLLPVCFWDERYSSVVAEDLAPLNFSSARRIDSYAASVILQEFLDCKILF